MRDLRDILSKLKGNNNKKRGPEHEAPTHMFVTAIDYHQPREGEDYNEKKSRAIIYPIKLDHDKGTYQYQIGASRTIKGERNFELIDYHKNKIVRELKVPHGAWMHLRPGTPFFHPSNPYKHYERVN